MSTTAPDEVALRIWQIAAPDPDGPDRPGDPGPCQQRRICLYTPSADPAGMGEHMLTLAAAYLPVADVSLLCRPTDGGRRLLDHAAGIGIRTMALRRPRDPAFAELIVDFLARHPADVFHIHVGTGRENFDGARAARRARVPLVLQTVHQPWLIRHPGKRDALLRAVATVDRLVAVSDAQRRTYERAGIPAASFTTVPNGIAPRGRGPGRRAARGTLGLHPDQLVVMTVGRLTEQKGQRHLVEATPELAARFPGLAVGVLGEGHLREELTRQAADLGVGDVVRFPGHRSDARLLLDAADVFVFPSRHEGMPLAVLEAMQARLPVVATDVVGTGEVVVDGRTGILTPPGNARALAAAVGELLADPERRRRYGEAGYRRYRERFTARRMAADTLALYEVALSELGARPARGQA
jgi:glycosyltransferase involved in cell wall biosynthesis